MKIHAISYRYDEQLVVRYHSSILYTNAQQYDLSDTISLFTLYAPHFGFVQNAYAMRRKHDSLGDKDPVNISGLYEQMHMLAKKHQHPYDEITFEYCTDDDNANKLFEYYQTHADKIPPNVKLVFVTSTRTIPHIQGVARRVDDNYRATAEKMRHTTECENFINYYLTKNYVSKEIEKLNRKIADTLGDERSNMSYAQCKLVDVLKDEIEQLTHALRIAATPKQIDKIHAAVKSLHTIVDDTNKLLINSAEHSRQGPSHISAIKQDVKSYQADLVKLPTSKIVIIAAVAFSTALLFAAIGFIAGLALTGGLDGGLTGLVMAAKAAYFSLEMITAPTVGMLAGGLCGGYGARYGLFKPTPLDQAIGAVAEEINQEADKLAKPARQSSFCWSQLI